MNILQKVKTSQMENASVCGEHFDARRYYEAFVRHVSEKLMATDQKYSVHAETFDPDRAAMNGNQTIHEVEYFFDGKRTGLVHKIKPIANSSYGFNVEDGCSIDDMSNPKTMAKRLIEHCVLGKYTKSKPKSLYQTTKTQDPVLLKKLTEYIDQVLQYMKIDSPALGTITPTYSFSKDVWGNLQADVALRVKGKGYIALNVWYKQDKMIKSATFARDDSNKERVLWTSRNTAGPEEVAEFEVASVEEMRKADEFAV